MIILLLLIIVAILLFGSSAVIGAIGAVLGGLVALIAIVVAITMLDISGDTLILCLLGFLALLFWFSLAQKRAGDATSSAAHWKPDLPEKPRLPDHVKNAMNEDRRLNKEYRTRVEASRKSGKS